MDRHGSNKHKPSPPDPRLLELRRTYGLHTARIMSEIGLADEASGRDKKYLFADTDSFMRKFTILGARLNIKEAEYLDTRPELVCSCQIPGDTTISYLEQLSTEMRGLLESVPALTLPADAHDPMKSTNFYMAMVDASGIWANMAMKRAKEDPLSFLVFMSMICEANIAEGNLGQSHGGGDNPGPDGDIDDFLKGL